MECLHAMRFLAKLRALNPRITMDGWSEIYRALQDNPGWKCGCPNQVLDPEREDWLHRLHREMDEDLDQDSANEPPL